MDLGDIKGIPERVNQVIKKFGTIDILINNGGVSFRGEIMDTDIETDMKIMNVNYFGQVALTKGKVTKVLGILSIIKVQMS